MAAKVLSPEKRVTGQLILFVCFLFKFSAVNVAFMAYTPSGIYHLK